MKLNPDCIRDVMLVLEDITGVSRKNNGSYSFLDVEISDLVKDERIAGTYFPEEVVYSVLQLVESGYIKANVHHDMQVVRFDIGPVFYLTPKGHDFVSSIYSEKEWKDKLKPVFEALGNVSLSVIEAVAKGFSAAALDRLLPPGQGKS